MSLDNFEDALDALRRDGRSFIICQQQPSAEGAETTNYRVQGELQPDADVALWGAILTAVTSYCKDAGDDASGNE